MDAQDATNARVTGSVENCPVNKLQSADVSDEISTEDHFKSVQQTRRPHHCVSTPLPALLQPQLLRTDFVDRKGLHADFSVHFGAEKITFLTPRSFV